MAQQVLANDLIEALRQLAIGMQQQQQQGALVVQPIRPRTATVAALPVFAGKAGESLDDWLAALNRAAEAEEWGPADQRRIAISKLAGVAAKWHDQTGHGFIGWEEWRDQLVATFEPQLTLTQWCGLMDARPQLPGETGVQYALIKAQLLRRCPVELPEEEQVTYLIRGLRRPEHVAVMMGAPPATLAEFLATIRRVELLSGPLEQPPPVTAAMTAPQPTADVTTALQTLGDRVVSAVDRLEKLLRPAAVGSTATPPAARMYPPRRPREEIQCYGCYQYGHFARECPRRPAPAPGNAMAGPSRQDQP